MTFTNPEDYEKIQPTDFVDLVGVESLAEGSKITLVAKHKDGSKDEIPLSHTFNEGQIGYVACILFVRMEWSLMLPLPDGTRPDLR